MTTMDVTRPTRGPLAPSLTMALRSGGGVLILIIAPIVPAKEKHGIIGMK